MEWTGWIPFDELPHIFDPPEHFIVTANHRPMPPGYPHLIALEFPSRIGRSGSPSCSRASTRLDAGRFPRHPGRHVLARTRRRCCRCCLSTRRPESDAGSAGARAAAGSGTSTRRGDSAGAAIFQAWFLALAPAIAGDELGPTILDALPGRFSFVTRFVTSTLTTPDSPWCDDVTTPGMRETCDRDGQPALQRRRAPTRRHAGRRHAAAGAGTASIARCSRIRAWTP